MLTINFRVARPDLVPERANPTDAGMDLKAESDVFIKWGERKLVDTGFSIAIPPGFVGLLVPRSSTPKRGLVVANSPGIIDSDYRGTIKVQFIAQQNSVDHYGLMGVDIKANERIAQLVIVPIILPSLIDVTAYFSDEEWKNTTVRGSGSFGSTGV